MSLKVRSDLRVEAVGEDLMVLDAADGQVHSLSGGLAEALRLVVAGTAPSDIPSHLDDALASLIDKGIVENGGWSRRKMLATGGVGAAAFGGTLISMQLPAAAAASSCPGADQGDDLATPITYNTPGSTSFKTGGMVTMVTVTAWGGGGGGGDDNGSNSRGGGGGGGGGFITTTVTVTPCTVYTVTVGDRGVTGTDTPGTDGTASSFTDFGINITAGGGKGGGWYPFGGMDGDNDGGAGGAAGTASGGSPSGTASWAGGKGGDGRGSAFNSGGGGGGGGSAGQGSAGGAGGANGSGRGAAGTAGTGSPAGAVGAIGGDNNGTSTGDAGAPGAPGGGGGGGGTDGWGSGNAPSAGAVGRVIIANAP